MSNLFTQRCCEICKTDPGINPKNPDLWFGFLDTETGAYICTKCREKHYALKIQQGAGSYVIAEMPVLICAYSPSPFGSVAKKKKTAS